MPLSAERDREIRTLLELYLKTIVQVADGKQTQESADLVRLNLMGKLLDISMFEGLPPSQIDTSQATFDYDAIQTLINELINQWLAAVNLSMEFLSASGSTATPPEVVEGAMRRAALIRGTLS